MSRFFKFLFVLSFMFLSKLSYGQKDVIITNAGEEIRCKILDETPTRFKYAYVGPKNKVLRNEIFKNLVSSFKYGYYENDLLKNEKEIVRGPMIPKPAEKPNPKEEKIDAEEKETSKVNVPAKPEPKAANKETPSKPVVKEIPAKDLARDLNKPSYPVNKQNKPVDVAPKKDEAVVTTPPIKKEDAVVTAPPIKKEDAVVTTLPIKKEDAKIQTPKVVNEVKPTVKEETPVPTNTAKKDNKPAVKEPKEIIKPIQKPEIVKAEPKIPEKVIVGSPIVKPEIIAEPAKSIEVPVKKEESKVASKPVPAKTEPVTVKKAEEIKPIEKKVEAKPEKKEEINVIIGDKTADKKDAEQKIEAKKDVPASSIAKFDQAKTNPGYKNYMKFRIGIKGGLGNIINKTSDTSPFGLYQEKLQRGWILGGDVSYFVKDWLGLGVKYASFQTNNSNDKLDFTNPISQEAIKSGSLSNKVSHKFVGPTVLIRKSIDFKTNIVITASPGINLYSDKGTFNANNFKLTGQSYGGNATLGLDFLLGNDIFGRDIILSIEGGYNYGSINKLVANGSADKKSLATPINLNRLDFGVGLRFTRFPMYLR